MAMVLWYIGEHIYAIKRIKIMDEVTLNRVLDMQDSIDEQNLLAIASFYEGSV